MKKEYRRLVINGSIIYIKILSGIENFFGQNLAKNSHFVQKQTYVISKIYNKKIIPNNVKKCAIICLMYKIYVISKIYNKKIIPNNVKKCAIICLLLARKM